MRRSPHPASAGTPAILQRPDSGASPGLGGSSPPPFYTVSSPRIPTSFVFWSASPQWIWESRFGALGPSLGRSAAQHFAVAWVLSPDVTATSQKKQTQSQKNPTTSEKKQPRSQKKPAQREKKRTSSQKKPTTSQKNPTHR
jgi:hypothetical protein